MGLSMGRQMTMQGDELILGIDGGGTKTVAWLARRSDTDTARVIGRGTAGGANPQAVGSDQALDNLNQAVDAACADADAPSGPFAAAVLALAGSDRDDVRRMLIRWADDRRLAHCFLVVHDAEPVLAAGTPDGWGVALIAGTGSLAFGRTDDGRTARSGGWGYLFGDEGSGYAVALAGLRSVAQWADDRAPDTQLVDGFLERLGLERPEQLVTAIHQSTDPRATIASLANIVTRKAEEGDEVAGGILDRAGRELAAMVAAVAGKLDLQNNRFPLALAGGLLTRSAMLTERLSWHLASLALKAEPIASVPDPVFGAVKLARLTADETSD